MRRPSPRTKSLRLGALGFLALGLFILSFAVPGMLAESRLRNGGVVAQATVTEWRVLHGRYGVSHEVRYVFRTPGGSAEYTLGDGFPLWRRNLWTSLSEERWEETKRTRSLDVRYLPYAPETNRPERPASLANIAFSLLIGLVGCGMGLALFWAERRGTAEGSGG